MDHKKKINFLPTNSNLKRGEWKKLENEGAKALRKGEAVKVYIEPLYNGIDIRPYKCEIEYSH